MAEPVRAIPLEYAPRKEEPRAWRRIINACGPWAWIACAVTLFLILFEVELVLIGGPTIFTLGVLLILGGIFVRDGRARFIGTSHCAICVLLFGLIYALDWSPTEARGPLLLVGGFYTACMVVPTARFVFHRTPWLAASESGEKKAAVRGDAAIQRPRDEIARGK